MSTFDHILNKYIQPLGLWQWVIFIVVNLTTYGNLAMFPQLSSLLPNHHCKMPVLEGQGWHQKAILKVAIPSKGKAATVKLDPCEQYNITLLLHDMKNNHTTHLTKDVATLIAKEKNKTLQEIPCQNGWWYNHKTAEFRHSFPEEFGLVCSHRYLIPITSSMYLIGTMVGRAGGGFVADRFGRKPVMLAASLITFVFGILVGVSPNVWTFCLFRFIVGVSSNAAVIVGIVLWSEITNDKHRNTLGVIFGVHESFIIPSFNVLLAYLTQNWRTLHMLLVVYYGFSVVHFCLIKDSPRWLLINNRVADAMQVIRRAIRWNRGKDTLSEETMKDIEEQLTATYGLKQPKEETKSRPWYKNRLLALFTKGEYRKYTLPLLVIWFVIMMGAIGFPFYSVRLKHNSPYLVAFVGFLVSLPAMFLKYILYDYFDRKKPLAGIFIVCAVSCVIQSVLRGFGIQGAAEATLATISLCSTLIAQNMAYTFTTECFPTACRNYATGLTSGLGRLGAVAATFVARLDQFVWAPLPMLIFAIFFVLAAVMVIIIPSIDVDELPDFTNTSEHSTALSDANASDKNEYGSISRSEKPEDGQQLTKKE